MLPARFYGQPGDVSKLAGGRGFEPRPAESESAVLPLNYPPPGAVPTLYNIR